MPICSRIHNISVRISCAIFWIQHEFSALPLQISIPLRTYSKPCGTQEKRWTKCHICSRIHTKEVRISCSSITIHRGSSILRNPSCIYNPQFVQTTPNFDDRRKKRRTASAAGWQQRRSSREPLREADEVALCRSGHVKLEKKRKLELLLRASNHPKPYNDTRKLGSPMAQDFGAEAETLGSTNAVDFNRSLGHGHGNNSN